MSEERTIKLKGLVPACCVVGAVIVMVSGHEGWGWLLIVALLAL